MKENTRNEYEKAVNRVIDYINHHLFDAPDIKHLAGIANISEYHFHRIFKTVIGENIGEYINRLRLEYIAEYLQTTRFSLDEIAAKTGYGTKYALSKAFKKHFGVSPSAYRSQDKDPFNFFGRNERKIMELAPEMREVPPKKVVYIRIIDWYGSPDSYRAAWKKLGQFAKKNSLVDKTTEFIGLSFDNPTITAPENCRFYACITTSKEVKPTGPFGILNIGGGLYAVFTLKGPYDGLLDMFYNIFFRWLPESGYKLRNGGSFEKYLNNPDHVSPDELLTEIYVPVAKRNRKELKNEA
ncbi:GyrI-like domain-containing protein [Prevotella sp. 10(H)]|uniref:AraC family transcriptional regulator n=1 Tax=Prevotella sp. 10(H) TaxID=1158294 RepID=UPI0004A77728|nr:AraC family transcriptional regulator [Prevotella sp. 10(H)]